MQARRWMKRVLINRVSGLPHALERKVLANALVSGRAKPRASGGIHQLRERRRHGFSRSRLRQKSSFAIKHHFWNGADSRGHNRAARGHRFREDKAKAFES